MRHTSTERTYLATETDDAKTVELFAMVVLVDDFAFVMRKRLQEKQRQGFYGWDDPGWEPSHIKQRIRDILDRDGPSMAIDLANFAAFLWNREEK